MSLKEWIVKAFSSDSDSSIKRITGFLIIIAVLVLLYFVAMAVVPVKIWQAIENFCETLVWVVVLFFGANATIDVIKILKNKVTTTEPPKKDA